MAPHVLEPAAVAYVPRTPANSPAEAKRLLDAQARVAWLIGGTLSKLKTTTRPPLKLIDCARQRQEAAQEKTMKILNALTVRALKGDVSDIMVLFKSEDDGERFITSGHYESHDAAVSALVRTTQRIAQDQLEGPE